MGALVEVIYTSGGDIIKFAGDAIICFFSSQLVTHVASVQGSRSGSRHGSGRNSISIKEIEREVEVDVLLRAMYCAEQLRDIQTDRLTVHVGVSAGEICFGLLGGYEDRWECLISGSCIEQLSQCLDDASSKQVVLTQLCKSSISREAAAKLGYIYTLEPLPSGNYLCDHVSFEPRGGGGKAPVATGNANRQNNPHTDNM
ncbi:hypothetical protein B484DRAFT_408820, partial [Ochromonadaceae sp. CCMP2298]